MECLERVFEGLYQEGGGGCTQVEQDDSTVDTVCILFQKVSEPNTANISRLRKKKQKKPSSLYRKCNHHLPPIMLQPIKADRLPPSQKQRCSKENVKYEPDRNVLPTFTVDVKITVINTTLIGPHFIFFLELGIKNPIPNECRLLF